MELTLVRARPHPREGHTVSRTVITTEHAPALPAPLSQGIRKGAVLQVSGQLPLDPDMGEVVGTTVAEQTTQTLRNVTAVLDAAGGTLSYASGPAGSATAPGYARGCLPDGSVERA